jgi:predicted nucleotidyltransferase
MAATRDVVDAVSANAGPAPASVVLRRAAARCARRLYDVYGARAVYLFGSLASGGPIHPGTDVDLAVEGLAPDRYIRALADVWDALPAGTTLDLVPLEAARLSLRARVQMQGRLIPQGVDDLAWSCSDVDEQDENGGRELGRTHPAAESPAMGAARPFTRALRADVEQELAALERLVAEMAALRSEIGTEGARETPTSVQVRAAASMLHDFYTSVERALSRVAVAVDGGLPAGPDWHMQLLRRMTAALPDVRPALVDEPLERALGELLRLRHLIRNVYGFELDWERMRPLADGLPRVSAAFAAAMRRPWGAGAG